MTLVEHAFALGSQETSKSKVKISEFSGWCDVSDLDKFFRFLEVRRTFARHKYLPKPSCHIRKLHTALDSNLVQCHKADTFVIQALPSFKVFDRFWQQQRQSSHSQVTAEHAPEIVQTLSNMFLADLKLRKILLGGHEEFSSRKSSSVICHK